MAFDPNKYAQLQAIDANLAAQYLASETQAAPAAPAPQPTFQAPAAPQAQAQSQYAPNPGQQAQQPQPELARGTLEDFYSQPTSSNGGKGASQYFKNKPVGSWLQFRVDRDITNADVSQLTDVNNVPQTWKYGPMAGKPKFQLVVPGTVLASSDGTHGQVFESGTLRLYLKPGPVTDAFRAALQAGGENSGFPKGGSEIVMIGAGEKQNKAGYSATKLYDFRYTAPNGQVTEGQVGVSPGGLVTAANPVAAQTPEAPAATTVPVAAPVPPTPTAPPAAPPAAPAAATPAEVPAPNAPVGPGGETREELLARLQGLGG